jgi:hypothetical protein
MASGPKRLVFVCSMVGLLAGGTSHAIAQSNDSNTVPASQSALCILIGSVEWDASPRGIEEGVPLAQQAVTGPLKAARVTLTGKSTNQVTQSDVRGAFRFTAPVGSYTIGVQASGYAPERHAITLEHGLNGDPICLDDHIGLRSIGVDSHLTVAQKAKLARIDAAIASQNAAVVSLKATAFPHVAERAWYSNLEAFNTTAASSGPNCQTMIRQANMMASHPSIAANPVGFKLLAVDAALCLRVLRMETPDDLPARIPKYYLVGACRITRATHENDLGYCAGISAK